MSTPTTHAPRTVQVGDVSLAVQEYGDGEPLLVINGTTQSLGFWVETAQAWAGRYRVITYDLRGMGGSERGSGAMRVASPPWHGRQVPDTIPGARLELYTGPGSSHALGVERAGDCVPLVLDS